MPAHFHITQGMQGGYLPDEMYTADSKAEARAMVADIARGFEDDAYEADRSVVVNEWSDHITIEYPDEEYTLGFIIEMFECDDSECNGEEI